MKNQGVFKYLKVLIDSGSRHLSIIGQLRKVYDRTVTKGRYSEESTERRNVANGSFGHDLLLEVQACVCREIGSGIIGKIDRGKQPSLQGTCQGEPFPQFPAGQRVQVYGPGAPTKEIDSTAAELAGTGTGHEKTNSSAFNQTMDFVQEFWQALDFIYDYQTVLRGDLLCNAARILAKSQKDRGVQKVVYPRFFQGVLDQKRLTGLAGPKKEMRLLIKERRQIQGPLNISGIFTLIKCCRFHRHISCHMTIILSTQKNDGAPFRKIHLLQRPHLRSYLFRPTGIL